MTELGLLVELEVLRSVLIHSFRLHRVSTAAALCAMLLMGMFDTEGVSNISFLLRWRDCTLFSQDTVSHHTTELAHTESTNLCQFLAVWYLFHGENSHVCHLHMSNTEFPLRGVSSLYLQIFLINVSGPITTEHRRRRKLKDEMFCIFSIPSSCTGCVSDSGVIMSLIIPRKC